MFSVAAILGVLFLLSRKASAASTAPGVVSSSPQPPAALLPKPSAPEPNPVVNTTQIPPQTQGSYKVGQVFYYNGEAYEVMTQGNGVLLTIWAGWIAAGTTVRKQGSLEMFVIEGTTEALLKPITYALAGTPPQQIIDPTTGYYVGGLSERGIQLTGLEVYHNDHGARYYLDSDGQPTYF